MWILILTAECISSAAAAVVQLPSCVRLFATPWNAVRQASLSFTISQSLLKLMSIVSVMLSNHLILCHPLLLPLIFPSIKIPQGQFCHPLLLPSIISQQSFPADFSNKSSICVRWPNYWSFSFGFSPFNGYSGLISWFDLLAVPETLKSLL